MGNLTVVAVIAVLASGAVHTPAIAAETGATRYMLESADGLRLHNLWIGPGTVAHLRELVVEPLR